MPKLVNQLAIVLASALFVTAGAMTSSGTAKAEEPLCRNTQCGIPGSCTYLPNVECHMWYDPHGIIKCDIDECNP